jgi:parallel beta-helix repeat protein
MVSNSSPVIIYNEINHEQQSNTAAGISLDNCYSGVVNHNQITDFNCGIYLYYSSPSLLDNTVINNTTSYVLDPYPLHANYLSSPRLKPMMMGKAGLSGMQV